MVSAEAHRIDLVDIPDVPVGCTASEAVSRLELSRVGAAISRLSAVDQEVLRMAACGETVTGAKRERDRFALHLFRARKRLVEALKGWLALGALAGAWQRRRWAAAVVAVAAVSALSTAPLIYRRDVPLPPDTRLVTAPPASSVVSGRQAERGGDPTAAVRHGDEPPPTATPEVAPPPRRFGTQLDVPSPSGGAAVRVKAEDRREERRPLICLRNVPVLGEHCSPSPEVP